MFISLINNQIENNGVEYPVNNIERKNKSRSTDFRIEFLYSLFLDEDSANIIVRVHLYVRFYC